MGDLLMRDYNDNVESVGVSKNITLCVTEECNLECKYCYMCKKNDFQKMSLDTGKRVIDFILEQPFTEEFVTLDFIGGEPLLEIKLIDQITDYFKKRAYELDHKWFGKHMISMSTNGVLYHLPDVQNFISKNKGHISIGMSVDGNKIKHDAQRVYPNGRGSYDDVMKNVPLWLEQFSDASTKATFAKGDLIHLKDSVVSLWDNGIKLVMANLVFDDYWTEEDADVYEAQLKSLADYVIDKNLSKDHYVRFFDPNIGFKVTEELKKSNYCGAGIMLATDTKGNLFPCIRFLEFTLGKKSTRQIGDIYKGIDENRVRAFRALTGETQSPKACNECEIGTGCSWCTGQNYDDALTETIFQRSIALCKMHAANVRANIYFWEKHSHKYGVENPREKNAKNIREEKNKTMLILTHSDMKPHCNYEVLEKDKNLKMEETVLNEALAYCESNGYIPIILGEIQAYQNIEGFKISNNSDWNPFVKVSINESDAGQCAYKTLIINREHIDQIPKLVKSSSHKGVERINLIPQQQDEWSDEDLENYKKALKELSQWYLTQKEDSLTLNVFDDMLSAKTKGEVECDSGEKSITLGPDGNFYICPGFYHQQLGTVGSLKDGVQMVNKQLLSRENAPICKVCDSTSCKRCKLQAVMGTGELNVPTRRQCQVNHVELSVARELQIELIKQNKIQSGIVLPERMTLDPIDRLTNKSYAEEC